MTAEKLAPIIENPISEGSPYERLQKTFTDEIVIALCGQLGTDLKQVSQILADSLTLDFGYDTEVINLSKFLYERDSNYPTYENKEYLRIQQGMNLGNELRSKYTESILADLVIAQIAKSRIKDNPRNDTDKGKFNSRRKCFIINSLKHPAEYRQLRNIYGATLYLIGVFSPYEERVSYLKSLGGRQDSELISTLINRDTGEDIQAGQKVEEVFIEADYFIRTYYRDGKLKSRIDRFLNLLFDYKINTPTVDERAMFQALSASVNSACLSRQVGACITDEEGNILSLGWNDVPKAGGGVYPYTYCELSDDGDYNIECDKRCLNTGGCKNSQRKENLKNEILQELLSKEIINNDSYTSASKVVESKLKSLIEFARSIHAEMHAIIIGAQKTGDKMLDGKLYCTTYPCHNCARHIVMAGIKEVYYIEPYRKSLCLDLHGDALTENEEDNTGKVKILMYEGVSPKMFIKFYRLIQDNRKQKVKDPEDRKTLSPKHKISLRALHQKEAISVNYLIEKQLLLEE